MVRLAPVGFGKVLQAGWALLVLVLLLVGIPERGLHAQDKAPPKPAAAQPTDADQKKDEQTPAAPEKAPEINLQGRGIIDSTPMPSLQQNRDEYYAYCDALVSAYGSTSQAFANSVNHELTYVQVFEEPHVYRGQVMHVEGRLIRVQHLRAPNRVWENGVNWLYEGWIVHPKYYFGNPVCTIFTHLPPGIKVGEELDYRVSFDGYFFKKYRFQSGRGEWHDCPLLIGHAPVLLQKPGGGAKAWSAQTVVITIALLLGIPIGLVACLTWWYRRSDRRIQSRLDVARSDRRIQSRLDVARTDLFVEPSPEEPKPEEPGTT